MKTKFIVMAAMAAMFSMGFTACSNNDEDLAGKEATAQARGIGFDVHADNSHATRGYATTAANAATQITNFQVWGFDAEEDELYMGTSLTVGRNATGSATSWSYEPVQFWPVNPLSFVAFTPNDYTAISGNAASCTDGVAAVASTVSIPAAVASQKDLMYAAKHETTGSDHPVSGDAGNVPLVFKHALSQIVFKGKLSADQAITKATVAEISLVNVASDGVINFNSTADGTFAAVSSLGTQNVTYTLLTANLTKSVFDYSVDGATAADITKSDDATNENAFMLLPQQLVTGGTLVKPGSAAPSDGKSYLKIRAQLEKGGVTILENTDAIYIPINTLWEQGKKYTYTIEFNGTKALTPITFTVTAEDWDEVDVTPALEM